MTDDAVSLPRRATPLLLAKDLLLPLLSLLLALFLLLHMDPAPPPLLHATNQSHALCINPPTPSSPRPALYAK